MLAAKLIWAAALIGTLITTVAFADDEASVTPDKSGYNLFNPVPDDQLRTFSPDRPTKSASATTVDAGHFQYEADFADWTYDRYHNAGITTSNFVIADPVFKVGLTNSADLELAFAPINANFAKDKTTHAQNSSFGFGDIYTRVKYNVIGNDGGAVALALTPFIKAPTASAAIGNGHWEGGIYAPLNITLADNWGLNFQSEYDRLERSDLSGIYSNYQNLINISHPLIWDKVTGYVEFWSDVSGDQGGRVEYTGDLSLAWLVKDNLQLDIGVNIGLNKVAPDLESYIGIAQRF